MHLPPKQIPQYGYLRLHQIVGPSGILPISKSSWHAGVRANLYPAPVRLGPRMTAWRATDIHDLMAAIDAGNVLCGRSRK